MTKTRTRNKIYRSEEDLHKTYKKMNKNEQKDFSIARSFALVWSSVTVCPFLVRMFEEITKNTRPLLLLVRGLEQSHPSVMMSTPFLTLVPPQCRVHFEERISPITRPRRSSANYLLNAEGRFEGLIQKVFEAIRIRATSQQQRPFIFLSFLSANKTFLKNHLCQAARNTPRRPLNGPKSISSATRRLGSWPALERKNVANKSFNPSGQATPWLGNASRGFFFSEISMMGSTGPYPLPSKRKRPPSRGSAVRIAPEPNF
ncbi:unnamed protein product [Trichogramma brassicae]|uniref:Uncharacterized protein n=1 Tax=Trichogramma brassicae TaxID=86971 RepID=A0A6H5I2L8_9HYME|nr:unnamed protein product [Trichogramma brassicae]